MAGNSNRNNSGTNVEPSLVSRISGAVRYAITGKQPVWFSPLAPLAPVAPAGTEGRQFDYQSGYNLTAKPRAYEPVSFEQMRALADNLDILRMVIETRKDQIAAQKFIFKPKDEDQDGDDPRLKELADFFAMPDKEHTWSDWLRMILEDLLVIDAATVYPRMTKGGKLYSFEVIDGATIKRVIDGGGRTPLPPDAAYQQVLHGLPAVDYTRDELVYKPSNPRSNKVYGYSRVEQIVMTINIAIRRQVSQLSYYTDGSTPDLIFTVPQDWNPDQVRQFKAWWDETLAGNIQGKRGTMFVPNGINTVNTKDAILTDKYDEWLARIICYAFSISPQPFTQQVNKATAETAQEVAEKEGIAPLMNWIKDLIDLLVVKYFGYTDLEFSWDDDYELDPLIKAQVSQIYLAAKVLTPDEVRFRDLSLEPMTTEQKDSIAPPPVLPAGGDEPPGKKTQAPTTKARKIPKINRNRKVVADQKIKLQKTLTEAFAKTLKSVTAQLKKSTTSSLTKDKKEDDRRIIMQELDDLDLSNYLEVIATAGAKAAFVQINYNSADDALGKANDKAIEWARNRAAELVGKRIDSDGNIVDNPNAEYRISDSTRDSIKSLVTQGEEEGWSNAKLAGELKDSYAFSDARAEMIATTETAMADVSGNMIAYRESGVVTGKVWLVAPGSCDLCVENGDAGSIDLDEDFPDGSDAAPAHPNCFCDTSPVVIETNETED